MQQSGFVEFRECLDQTGAPAVEMPATQGPGVNLALHSEDFRINAPVQEDPRGHAVRLSGQYGTWGGRAANSARGWPGTTNNTPRLLAAVGHQARALSSGGKPGMDGRHGARDAPSADAGR